MKFVILFIVLCLSVFLIVQIYSFWSANHEMNQEFTAVKNELQEAKINQNKLKDQLEYLLNPRNLEKELRSRFNLRYTDEKMIIIPNNATSVSTSS